jgi:hypothetical protein
MHVKLVVKRVLSVRNPGIKKPGTGPGFRLLVAGARYANYMQIEIEPFPLVA